MIASRSRSISAVLASSAIAALVAACSPSSKLTFGTGGGGSSSVAVVVGSGGQAGGPGGEGGAGAEGGVGGVGGQGGEGGFEVLVAPPLRNPVSMSDADLAYQSLILMGHQPLGATTQTCSQCHALNSGTMNNWRALTDTAVAGCLSDPPGANTKPSAEAVLTCLRKKPQPSSPFSTQKLGIYAAAAHLDWFSFVFDVAYTGNGAAELADFQQHVAMPKSVASPFTQGDFDIIAEWFARGLPLMEELLPGPPGPGGCTPNITPAVGNFLADAKLYGWRALNQDANLLMFGCAGAATTLDCLSSYPLASSVAFGAGWEHMPGATLRILRTNGYESDYWTRSSADGRFVGHGGGTLGSTIVDLALDQQIAVDAAYDPAFFPDNSGFMFQGAPGGAAICSQSLLSSTPASITFQEPQCSTGSQIGLYQHVGTAPGNGDYWAVNGDFVSDNGGTSPTLTGVSAFFDPSSDIKLTAMIFNGSSYVPKASMVQSTPYEGDVVISPSRGLLMSRLAGNGWVQNGFVLRSLVAIPNGNSYNVTIPEIARYCINGSKPGISYDERWAVVHRYVTAADAVELGFSGSGDPGFAPYASQGAANIYLLDLLTGLVRRVTHMHPGQYALYPHFRSDGWIYFMVRTLGTNDEHIVASDAALSLEN